MVAWVSRLRRYLPRRRRVWRYVSGRRRGAGLVTFGLLVLVAYEYWLLTNDARVQKVVGSYLGQLVGGKVRIDQAHFSLFGGIRVKNLRLFATEDSDVPYFQAPQVLLSHRPSSLLLRGRLAPTEIVCVRPKVTLIEDVRTEELNIQRIFPLAGREAGLSPRTGDLPAIRLREGKLELFDLDDGRLIPVAERPLPWGVTLLPGAEGNAYQLSFEGQEGTISGSGTINLLTGEARFSTGWVPIPELGQSLPRRFRTWRRRYQVTGQVSLSGQGRLELTPGTGPAKESYLTARLVAVSMQLPKEEGGLGLRDVSGEVVFHAVESARGPESRPAPAGPKAIEIKNLSGQIAESPGATFTLSGFYGGYEPTSEFRLTGEIKGLVLPVGANLIGPWARPLNDLLRRLQPAGPVDIEATLHRDEAGNLHAQGLVELRGVTIVLPFWPIRVEGLTGVIALSGDAVELKGLRGRHGRGPTGQAEVEITGRLENPLGEPSMDILLTARGLPFSDEVRRALPEEYRPAWDLFAPRGQADFEFRVQDRPGQEPLVSVSIDLTGKASMEYAGFPYRLEELTGQLRASPEGVEIRSIRGRSGDMTCTIKGRTGPPGKPADFDVTVDASDLALDERLAAALPRGARAAYEAFALTGRADVTGAAFRRRPGGALDFRVPVALKDAAACHRDFAYPIRDAVGTVVITPGAVRIERLVGWNGRARISLSGQALLSERLTGCDLKIEAGELDLTDQLRSALPESARLAWDILCPSGTADATMTFRAPPPGGQGQPEYRLEVRPRQMQVLYRHFPYPLRLVAGQVVVAGGQMTLSGLKGQAGSAEVALEGKIDSRAGKESVELSVRTGALAIDERLLSALPRGVVETLRLEPGGTAALALKSLCFRPAEQPTTRPATLTAPAREGGGEPATRAIRVIRPEEVTTQPADAVAWSLDGRIALDRAVMDLGLGGKSLSGYLDGRLACSGGRARLQADADLVVEPLVVGPRTLGKFTGRLVKKPESPILQVREISGQAYGGRVAGLAELRLAEPVQYGLSLSLENMDLAKFLAAAPAGQAPEVQERPDVQGLMSGNLQITGSVNDASARRATGTLHVTQAKIHRLPILLGFLHVIFLTLPSDTAFHTAQADYRLRGDDLTFQEIHLQGSVMSMVGGGTMNLKTSRLNLTFIMGPPRKLPPLGALKDVLEGLAGELTTVRVTGTLTDPKTEPVPLRSLKATIRELLGQTSP